MIYLLGKHKILSKYSRDLNTRLIDYFNGGQCSHSLIVLSLNAYQMVAKIVALNGELSGMMRNTPSKLHCMFCVLTLKVGFQKFL